MTNNILIVDDEKNILESFSRGLKEKGYVLDTATNGIEALKKIKKKEFDLVITDLRMPEMDREALLDKLDELYTDSDMEKIVVTAYGDMETVIKCLREGKAYDFLTKPLYDREILFNAVKKAIEHVECKKREILFKDFTLFWQSN